MMVGGSGPFDRGRGLLAGDPQGDIVTAAPAPSPATTIVSELRRRSGELWECLVTLPDGTRHRLVVPADVASVHGIQLSAAALATFYADQAARRAAPQREG